MLSVSRGSHSIAALSVAGLSSDFDARTGCEAGHGDVKLAMREDWARQINAEIPEGLTLTLGG
eukprot:355557-Chlamydomonas_euryale.AAC.5